MPLLNRDLKTQVMESSHWKFEKFELENGLKMRPFICQNILMYNIREFHNEFIEVSHV